uniref:hypothetical protein n=1 Tax=Pedobacter schmidteae TaxID=2201271 RepID=UPI000EB5C858|nr:hypothetical protein [Pedobacter schmidteae]
MIRANLTYNVSLPLPTALVFNTPVSALLWERTEYLYARSPDLETPIIFTSSNPAVLKVELKNSFWQMEYCGLGTATVTASQTGQTPVVQTVTVNQKPAASGRVINVGGSGGYLSITTTELGILPGDTIVIAAGNYNGVYIEDILVNDGSDPVTIITDGLVKIVNEGNFSFKNLRNVVIDGCRVPGVKQALLLDGQNYRGVYWNNLNYVTIYGVELRDVYDTAWFNDWSGMDWIYDGTAASYQKGCKFINCKSDNSGAFSSGGRLDVFEPNKLTGLLVDFQFIGWEAINSSAGSLFFISAGQNILFKDCTIDHVNCVNNNHNGVLFVSGHADLVNNRLTNFEGNMIRNWTFSIVDTHFGPQHKTSRFYGNQVFCSRKYGAFEGQSFDRYDAPGFTEYCNIDMFNNTVGNMNLNHDPTVFTGTAYDNYDLHGGRARVFNTMLINPVNPTSNNIFLTYNSAAIGGTEHQSGDMWEWNNRVYYTINEARVNEANLAPKTGNSGKGKSITNAATADYTRDRYGNLKVDNIGAIQCNDIVLPIAIALPSVPGIEAQTRNAWSSQKAEQFMIDCKASNSPIGIKNYDMERNGILITTDGGYCRDGKPDPEVSSDHLAWTAYTYRWRARDWRGQLSVWTEPMTFGTEPVTTELDHVTIPTITKLSGGTLVNTSGVYSATGSAVIVSTGLIIPAGYAARLIIDHNVGQGVFGWSAGANPVGLIDIKAAISTNEDGSRYEAVASGVRSDQRDVSENELISLFISYNGDSWCERSSDGGKSWNKPGNQLTSYYFQGSNNKNAKHVVGYIPIDRVLSQPKVVLYPEPTAI